MIGRIGGSNPVYSIERYRPYSAPLDAAGTVQNRRVSDPGQASAVEPSNPSVGPRAVAPTECKTCKSRRYQDVSSDPGVSMKSPTALTPGEAESAVRAHEGEHVVRELAKAGSEDRQAIATVVLHTEICPECGRVYLSGGTTRVTSWGGESDENVESPTAASPQ